MSVDLWVYACVSVCVSLCLYDYMCMCNHVCVPVCMT